MVVRLHDYRWVSKPLTFVICAESLIGVYFLAALFRYREPKPLLSSLYVHLTVCLFLFSAMETVSPVLFLPVFLVSHGPSLESLLSQFLPVRLRRR